MTLFAYLLFFAFPHAMADDTVTTLQVANVATLQVDGVEVHATGVEYYTSGKIFDFNVVDPVVFPLSNGNSITAASLVTLDELGNLSVVVSSVNQLLEWKLPDGRSWRLDCSVRIIPVYGKRIARAVGFYPNHAYHRGCDLIDVTEFSLLGGGKVKVSGAFEANADAGLIYSSKILEGQVVVGGQKLVVLPGTEMDVFPTGLIHFFTMAKGQSFTVTHPVYGMVKFAQSSDRPISTSFYDDGHVENGIIAQDLVHNELHYPIPAGSGVMFDQKDQVIDALIYNKPVSIAFKQATVLIANLFWDRGSSLIDLISAADFQILNPSTGSMVTIPAGALIKANLQGEILSIGQPPPH